MEVRRLLSRADKEHGHVGRGMRARWKSERLAGCSPPNASDFSKKIERSRCKVYVYKVVFPWINYRKAAGGSGKKDMHHGRGVSRVHAADLRYVPGPYLGGLGEVIKARGGGEGGMGRVHASLLASPVFHRYGICRRLLVRDSNRFCIWQRTLITFSSQTGTMHLLQARSFIAWGRCSQMSMTRPNLGPTCARVNLWRKNGERHEGLFKTTGRW